ncbi:MAG: HAMP domain-containing histidine kinase [Candidatus Levybacteria bacterium]|nr:HAMP domain-containing histidine kinase [Candidatus Levybacteria bacterium]
MPDLKKVFLMLRDKQTDPWYCYGFALLLSVVGFLLIFLLRIAFDMDRMSLFLLLFPLIAFSSIYGGFRAGLTTTILTTASLVGLYAYQYHTLQSFPMTPTIQIAIFVAESIFISFLIDKVKRFDIISKYAIRERKQKLQLFNLEQEILVAKKNIKARDEFLSFVSHELKTPLTSMLLQSQLALHSIRNVSLAKFSIEKLLTMLENSETQTKQLAKMVNDLMNVSLITTGKLELEKEEVDLGDLVNDVISRMEDKAHEAGYDITTDIENGVVGQWDRGRLEQVITNLFSNAIKYGNQKPINIAVFQKGEHAKVTITDRGIGIPKELRGKLFTRFERGTNAHEFEGLGVGLYISMQIIKAHNGTIEVQSTQGKGATFTITLPIN